MARDTAAAELARQVDVEGAKAVVFFCSPKHDGAALSAALHRRYPVQDTHAAIARAGKELGADGAAAGRGGVRPAVSTWIRR